MVTACSWNAQDQVLKLAQFLTQEVDQKSGAIMQSSFELRIRKTYHVWSEEGVHPDMDASDAGAVE
jgi:hypothetical protein